MPRPDFKKLLDDPNFLKEKTPSRRWREEQKKNVEDAIQTINTPVQEEAEEHMVVEQPSKQTEKPIMTTVKPEEVINEDKKSFLWPFYGSTCTDEEKKEFETTLKSLCASTDKCMTRDVKEFLKRKGNEGTIIRPKQITQEHEIVKKFGYPYSYKAYSKY